MDSNVGRKETKFFMRFDILNEYLRGKRKTEDRQPDSVCKPEENPACKNTDTERRLKCKPLSQHAA